MPAVLRQAKDPADHVKRQLPASRGRRAEVVTRTKTRAGADGFIHEVLRDRYRQGHSDPKAVEYYLGGPPMMIKACSKMLAELGVPDMQVAFDEF